MDRIGLNEPTMELEGENVNKIMGGAILTIFILFGFTLFGLRFYFWENL